MSVTKRDYAAAAARHVAKKIGIPENDVQLCEELAWGIQKYIRSQRPKVAAQVGLDPELQDAMGKAACLMAVEIIREIA